MSIVREKFGETKKQEEVSVYRLTNLSGAYIEVLDFGAVLRAVVVPDARGTLTDVVLGYDNVSGYENGTCYFGAIIGRNGNRIAGGQFRIGEELFQMPINENCNNLHSGPDGFESRIWEVKEMDEEDNSITFSLHSPAGDHGFPGNFDVTVKYQLSSENELIIHYTGISDADTVANMTNHSYFNLEGHDSGSNGEILLTINADAYTPVAYGTSIPTGELALVEGTPMDFRREKPIGRDIDDDFEQLRFTGGFDHNYALNDYEPGIVQVAARAFAPKTGITMEVLTDLPGVQFYAANFVMGQHGKKGAVYEKRSAFCLETQYYPNSINQKTFLSPLLKKDETYNTVTIYRFTAR